MSEEGKFGKFVESTEVKGISRLMPTMLLGLICFLGMEVWGDVKVQKGMIEDMREDFAKQIGVLTGRINMNEYRINVMENQRRDR